MDQPGPSSRPDEICYVENMDSDDDDSDFVVFGEQNEIETFNISDIKKVYTPQELQNLMTYKCTKSQKLFHQFLQFQEFLEHKKDRIHLEMSQLGVHTNVTSSSDDDVKQVPKKRKISSSNSEADTDKEESNVRKTKTVKRKRKKDDKINASTDSESDNEVEKSSKSRNTSETTPKKDETENVTKKRIHRKKKIDSDEEDLHNNGKDKSKSNEKKKKSKTRDRKEQKKTSDKDEKKESKQEGGDDESSSDEDLNEVNKVFKKTPTFKSLKDLVHGKRYRCSKFELVNTTKGDRIRIQLHDNEFPDSMAFVHLPERINPVLIPKLESYNMKCASTKPIFLIYRGLKGKAFDVRFTRKPK